MKTKAKLVMYLCIGISLTDVHGQEATVASGSSVSGAGGSISYSLGQIDYTTNVSPSGTISQGVQQPIEIYSLSTGDFTNIHLQILVYPNPTANLITLLIKDVASNSFEYQLFDLTGSQIVAKKISHAETQIPLENLPEATYLLNVMHNNKIVRSFKIIKTN